MESRLQRDQPEEWLSLPSLCPRRQRGAGATGRAFLSVCRCEWISVACFSLDLSVSECTSTCLCLYGASMLRHPIWASGLRDPSLALEWRARIKQPPICHLLTDHFLPAEQCPAPWGLPVYPLAHHPSGFRGNTEFTQPGPSLLFHAHRLQHR